MRKDIENLRALVILSVMTLGIAVAMSFIEMPVTDQQAPFLAGRGAGAVVTADTSRFLFIAWLVVYAIAHALAFFLSWLARYCFLLAFGLAVLMPALGGLSVGSPWDNTAWESLNNQSLVIPANAGTQCLQSVTEALDPGVRRDDE